MAETNQSRIAELAPASPDAAAKLLADELNRILASGPLFQEARFAGVTLSPKTGSLLATAPRDAELLRLNRRLLEEAYPQELLRKEFLGHVVNSPAAKRSLFVCSVALLLACYLFCRWLTSSRFGLIQRAVRDSENRVLFSGYATADFKLFVFVVAAVIASLGGALFVPLVGIINPVEMAPEKSIEAVVWVAVGGRGSMLGPILGAVGINSLKSHATHSFAEQWPYVLGALFVLGGDVIRGFV
ncbi:MAG TPA: hypothetical protein PKE47_08650, partial [Verrucomicrobiota bacterium]|nr:hypothetical protein [Verrucomicrobiota bacterium]